MPGACGKNSVHPGVRQYPLLLKNPLLGIEELDARSQFHHPRLPLHSVSDPHGVGFAARVVLLAQDLSGGINSPQFYIELYSTAVVWFTCPRSLHATGPAKWAARVQANSGCDSETARVRAVETGRCGRLGAGTGEDSSRESDDGPPRAGGARARG